MKLDLLKKASSVKMPKRAQIKTLKVKTPASVKSVQSKMYSRAAKATSLKNLGKRFDKKAILKKRLGAF